MLFNTIESLASSLKEVQSLGNMNLQTMQRKLNFHKNIVIAEELMRNTEESAPFITAAIRKGLPILDRNLVVLLEEIQEKVEITLRNQ